MRHIRKGSEPKALTEHRLTPHTSYENLDLETREAIVAALVREQGGLCAYCMSRIDVESAHVEHYIPQSDPTEGELRQLEWQNLLGVCHGGRGRRPADQHCDVRRGNAPLKVDPRRDSVRILVAYTGDGRIKSDDPIVDEDLNLRLNLNLERLRSNRHAELAALLDEMTETKTGGWSRSFLERKLAEIADDSTGDLREYCGFLEWLLRKRLGRL